MGRLPLDLVLDFDRLPLDLVLDFLPLDFDRLPLDLVLDLDLVFHANIISVIPVGDGFFTLEATRARKRRPEISF